MELHRLDGVASGGFTASGLDNLDVRDIGFETEDLDTDQMSGQQVEALEALGYVHDPDIVYEIQDEAGNVVMYADAEENLYVIDGLGELGFFKKIGRGLKNASRFVSKKVVKPTTRFVGRKVIKPAARGVSQAAKFTGKKILTPAFKTFNRYANPATILLRNGFLLAMKTNMFKVAERLRFGYLSDAEARKRGVNMSEFAKLKKVVARAGKIYEGAGGKQSNLKKAILTGKGNRNKAVPLSGLALGTPYDLDPADLYVDETERFIVEADLDTVEAMLEEDMTIEGLGEVATGTAIAAASGVVASVATLLSKITGVFDKAGKVPADIRSSISSAQTFSAGRSTSPLVRQLPRPLTRFTPRTSTTSLIRQPSTSPRAMVTTPGSSLTDQASATASKLPLTVTVAEDGAGEPGFFQKNKTPIMIGVGAVVVGGGIYYSVKQSKKKPSRSIDGVPRDGIGRFKGNDKVRAKSSRRKKTKKLVPTVLL